MTRNSLQPSRYKANQRKYERRKARGKCITINCKNYKMEHKEHCGKHIKEVKT